jgi:hypothetical protein
VTRILEPLDITLTGNVDRTIFEIAEPKDKFGEEIWPEVLHRLVEADDHHNVTIKEVSTAVAHALRGHDDRFWYKKIPNLDTQPQEYLMYLMTDYGLDESSSMGSCRETFEELKESPKLIETQPKKVIKAAPNLVKRKVLSEGPAFTDEEALEYSKVFLNNFNFAENEEVSEES